MISTGISERKINIFYIRLVRVYVFFPFREERSFERERANIPSTKSLALDLLSSTPQEYSHSSSGLHSFIINLCKLPSFSN